MRDAFLVNLDEVSMKDFCEEQGQVKDLFTEPTFTLNEKGKNQRKMKSFHRFIITTNNEVTIPTSKDDRRTITIKCSDELKGTGFTEYNRLIRDTNTMRTVMISS